jgi:hypothetical protein
MNASLVSTSTINQNDVSDVNVIFEDNTTGNASATKH